MVTALASKKPRRQPSKDVELEVEIAEIRSGVESLLADRANAEFDRRKMSDILDTVKTDVAVVKSEVERLSPTVSGLEIRVAKAEGARNAVGGLVLAMTGAAGGAVGAMISYILNRPIH